MTKTSQKKILVVDDEENIQRGVGRFLEREGFAVEGCDSIKDTLEAVEKSTFDLILLDYNLPDGNSLDLLPKLKTIANEAVIIILTAHGSIDLAVKAIKEGAEQ